MDLRFELQDNFNVAFVNEFHKAFNDVYQYARQQMGIAQPIYGHHVEDITEYTLSLQKNTMQSHKLQNDQGKTIIAKDSFVPLL